MQLFNTPKIISQVKSSQQIYFVTQGLRPTLLRLYHSGQYIGVLRWFNIALGRIPIRRRGMHTDVYIFY